MSLGRKESKRRANGKKSEYLDCGAWISTRGSCPKTALVVGHRRFEECVPQKLPVLHGEKC